MKKLLLAVVVIAAVAGFFAMNGYNRLNTLDESIRGGWAEVLNQYQRRADLVPNLVETVKGFAEQEKEIFTAVTEARSKVGEIKLTPELASDPAALERFQQAQSGLGSALSRLIAVSENYPQLKSDTVFRDLQAQLEGTENRITVARNRYIQAIQGYNTTVRTFPSNLIASYFGFNRRPNFQVEDEEALAQPPAVNFNN